jgi:hypothetical protein
MKTLLLLSSLVSFTFACAGQEDLAVPSPTLVYETPVVYQSPVVYQAPVYYEAPVYYTAPDCDEPVASAPCCTPSTVVFIGGREGVHSVVHCGNSGPSIIHFGGEQACRYGYRFNTPR